MERSIIDVVRDYLAEAGITSRVADAEHVEFGLAGKNANFEFVAYVVPEPAELALNIMYPLYVPENLRLNVAELCARVNNRLNRGFMSVSFDNGAVGYRQSLMVADAKLTTLQVDLLIAGGMSVVDGLFGLFADVLYKGAAPAEVIARLPGGPDQVAEAAPAKPKEGRRAK